MLMMIGIIAGIAGMTYGLICWLNGLMDSVFGDDCLEKFFDDCSHQGRSSEKEEL